MRLSPPPGRRVRFGPTTRPSLADDEPAPVADWLPELARALGARPPRHVPVWLGRLATGEVGVSMMTRIRGASNAKARQELGWRPRYPSYRDGFHTGLGDLPIPMPETHGDHRRPSG